MAARYKGVAQAEGAAPVKSGGTQLITVAEEDRGAVQEAPS